MKGYHVFYITGLLKDLSGKMDDDDVSVTLNQEKQFNEIKILAKRPLSQMVKDTKFMENSLGTMLIWRERKTMFFIKLPFPSNEMKWVDLFKILQEGAKKYADASDTNKPEDEKGNPTPLARIKEHIDHSHNLADAFDTLLDDYVSMASESHNDPGLPEWATKKLTKIADVMDGKKAKQ